MFRLLWLAQVVISEKSIVYTSGTGAIFKSGIPIGRLKTKEKNSFINLNVEFYSDFSQLKYVFAELIAKNEIDITNANDLKKDQTSINLIESKISILEEEIEIIEDTNLKFKEENETLKKEINNLNNKILNFKNEISSQNEKINKYEIDKNELQFLRLNLSYGHLCRKSFLNNKGFKVGTEKYKDCVFRKGRKN